MRRLHLACLLLAFLPLITTPAHAYGSFDPGSAWSAPQWQSWQRWRPFTGFEPYRHRHHARAHHGLRQARRGHHGEPSLSLAGFPSPLVAKVEEICKDCGSRIASAFRPGAVIAGTNHPSLHASKRAVDVSGNPSCIYHHLAGWPGGYTTDYGRMGHVHISYAPGGPEWGARFAHGGSGHRYAWRHHRHYALRHRRYARAW